jgi:ADP-heptose:LPS heptosyltransferase
MKILVVSLLRLGDVLQQNALLGELVRLYPNARIDFLINDSAEQARAVMPQVKTWHVFSRKHLQNSISNRSHNLFKPIIELEKLITTLSNESYDCIYNWTHTKISAYLIEQIKASHKIGLVSEGENFLGVETEWQKYFNCYGGAGGKTLFHMNEMLAAISGLELCSPRQTVHKVETNPLIVFQPLTSDHKKNWSLRSWKSLMHATEALYPKSRVRILGAPFERQILESIFTKDKIEILNLSAAAELLSKANMLVTGDTAIKHLAALKSTPILEISLGSADAHKNGAYLSGVFTLSAKLSCMPCAHSMACHQPSQLCAESLMVDDICEAMQMVLSGSQPKSNGRILITSSRWFEQIGMILDNGNKVELLLNLTLKAAQRLRLSNASESLRIQTKQVLLAEQFDVETCLQATRQLDLARRYLFEVQALLTKTMLQVSHEKSVAKVIAEARIEMKKIEYRHATLNRRQFNIQAVQFVEHESVMRFVANAVRALKYDSIEIAFQQNWINEIKGVISESKSREFPEPSALST